ncbi:hypothetical protein [Necropsobacter massiliensis]|uniref:hypothetical protein n=1 Tax=Necropsobacter massiliensis TaxID=1400001 RepID=UPI001C560549|nr:hypothetical protein [Necropsobacter massiliensis]
MPIPTMGNRLADYTKTQIKRQLIYAIATAETCEKTTALSEYSLSKVSEYSQISDAVNMRANTLLTLTAQSEIGFSPFSVVKFS